MSWTWTAGVRSWLAICASWCLWAPAARADSPAVATADQITRRSLTLRGPGPMARGVQRLELRADRLAFLPARSCQPNDDCPATVELEGAVRLRLDRLELRAARATLSLDPSGQAIALVASGAVTLVQRERRGRARRVELSVSSQRVTLIGGAVLQAKGLSLRGDRVELELRSGRVTVHNARVRLGERGVGRGGGP